VPRVPHAGPPPPEREYNRNAYQLHGRVQRIPIDASRPQRRPVVLNGKCRAKDSQRPRCAVGGRSTGGAQIHSGARDSTADFPIVGIGSSADGLEALEKLFDAMPPDPGVAFVVIAHLDSHP
jgi:chemotaxis response regulator CheB